LPVKHANKVNNIEYSTEDTAEPKDEQVQESEGEDSGLDTNIMQASNKRVHPVSGSLCWFNI
jgi:hypothetical protein